ncbi:ROK family protein [Labedella endophytica]|uniref:ROK family protein n=1 Tax=Labedella endophytica TaxID=1523160 RepID=A0A433JNU8_9MICO|nr:ROK family protein [Labedella endophytica]RUQ98093.1 ROK family protein [Labedella endophytica]
MRIGIDIGGTKTDAVIVDDSLVVRQHLRRPTGRGNVAVVDGAERIVRDLLDGVGATTGEVEQIGVGIPGVVDELTGRVRHAVNIGVAELELAAILGARLSIPVVVGNDVNAAALGASHLLDLHVPTAFLNLGTGLAAGLVVDGRVWRGARGGAGEIGHIPVDPSGALCPCGQRGCLETMASGSALARLWPTDAALPAVDLFERAEAGQQNAVAVRETVVTGVASAVRVLLLSTDVETVIIGGGLSNLGERLMRPLRETFERWGRTSPFLDSLDLSSRVRLLPPESPAAALGAALLDLRPLASAI